MTKDHGTRNFGQVPFTPEFNRKMERLLRRFRRKDLFTRYVRKAFPRAQQEFVELTCSVAMGELAFSVHKGKVRSVKRYIASGQISRPEYRSYSGFAAELTRRVALQNYRKRNRGHLRTNSDALDLVCLEPISIDPFEEIGDFDLKSFVVLCLRRARQDLSPLAFKTLCLRLHGATFSEIGQRLEIDRNKASALLGKACMSIGIVVENQMPPKLFGILLKHEVKRTRNCRIELSESMSSESYAALIPENPEAVFARRFVEFRCQMRRQRTSIFNRIARSEDAQN